MSLLGRIMNPEFYRRFALQCRELLARACTDPTKQQLRIWIDEFETHAEAAEREVLAHNNPGTRGTGDRG